MSDDLGLFTEPDVHSEDQQRRPRGKAAAAARRAKVRRKRTVLWTVVALVLALGGVGAYYGYQTLMGIGSYEDFEGTGETDVVIEVKDGDPVTAIAATLKDQGVTASSRAFTEAGKTDARLTGIQPGFYLMKTKMSGSAAVARMLDKSTKITPLEVKGGNVLHDIAGGDGKVTKGILSMLSEASCLELDGVKKCVTPEELRTAAETADPVALGVPDWALPDVNSAEKAHRLEGLIAPGLYQLKPGATAVELLNSVITTSVTRLQSYGVVAGGKETGYRPYDILKIASLVEKEGLTKDFGKVSRVIYNRLAINKILEFDSTVNYKLDKPNIRTSDSDREAAGPYNTYSSESEGLTPTPIGSPSREAVEAAINPEPGKWLFFVKCQKDGTSCFNETFPEHEKTVAKAIQEGVF
ncbi:endolytic transglycosylase MltG [Umezawaea sp.]|uniref:endolytic transglycosylase MltG n=1 Tax=Umezawaea sp. TaxID=1955258 RepID=UPI002ED2D8E5